MVTIFKNIRETSAPFHRDIEFVLNRIKDGKYEDLVKQIRREKDKTKRNELKKGLPAICFSGEFAKRSDDAIIKHSGYICLDFDGYKTKKDMVDFKEILSKDPYVMSAFVSPSGNGLKVIVKIPADPQNHKAYFNALGTHFNTPEFDVACSNVSRVCYESFDKDIYVNLSSELWDKMEEEELKVIDRNEDKPTIPIVNENRIIEALMTWWNKNYGLVEGSRNNNIYILASAFNDYGISQSLAEYVLNQMSNQSFPESEIKTTINSAYGNRGAHGSKYFEDNSAVSKIRSDINEGKSADQIKEKYKDLNVDSDTMNDVIKEIEKDSSVKKFWYKSDRGSISVVHYLFKEFLEQNGFYKFAPHNSDKHMFVRVTNNLVDRTTEIFIKDFVLDYLQKFEDLSIYNYFVDKTRFFKEDFLSMLGTINIHFVNDTKDYSYIYFRNCALKVTANDIKKIDYIDLNGYVWNDQVIDRDFDFCDIVNSDYKTLISNVSGGMEGRIKTLESTIGYLMSGYKDPGFCPAVILNDEVISEDPEGGTGKGLFIRGIGEMKKIQYINGKEFSFDKPFAYQTITTDTQVISFDDVRRGFDFERLFSVITEGITIERKNKDAIRIPFKHSPKVAITTNYAIGGSGNSFERRKWEIEFKQHYSKQYTPVHEFGRRLFDEWSEDDWCSFDNYMISNLQLYLREGLVFSELHNLLIKNFIRKTSYEFAEWSGMLPGGERPDILQYDRKVFKNTIMSEFVQKNPDFGDRGLKKISNTKFYKWLRYYADINPDVLWSDDGRSESGRWIIYSTVKPETDEQEKELTLDF